MKNRWFLYCMKWIIFFFISSLLLGFVVMKLWNWILPDLFSVAPLTYLQALGLLVLAKILFGNFKMNHCQHCSHKGSKGSYWRKKFEDKLESMTPEERERFKENYYTKCGGAWREKDDCE